MCGRYTQTADGKIVAARFECRPGPVVIVPRFNIAPGQTAPAIVAEAEGPVLRPMRWGFSPRRDGGRPLINARSETARERPAFREALARRRCLVPADGFYEWTAGDGCKRPVRFTLPGGGLFAMAGLWAAGPGGVLEYVILTTAASRDVAPVHHRMPVLLPREAESAWIDPAADPVRLREHLHPAPDGSLRAAPAHPKVNSAAVDDPSCLVPPERELHQGILL
jgi:putative SOS response-associated peptidase YedK